MTDRHNTDIQETPAVSTKEVLPLLFITSFQRSVRAIFRVHRPLRKTPTVGSAVTQFFLPPNYRISCQQMHRAGCALGSRRRSRAGDREQRDREGKGGGKSERDSPARRLQRRAPDRCRQAAVGAALHAPPHGQPCFRGAHLPDIPHSGIF